MLKIILIIAVICIGVLLVSLYLFAPTCIGEHYSDKAQNEASIIRSATMLFAAQNKRCPKNVDELLDGYLDPNKRTVDPWRNEYLIHCGDVQETVDEVFVYSAGADGEHNTDDDIVVGLEEYK